MVLCLWFSSPWNQFAQAVAEADEKGVRGKDSTPFLLAKIVELTGDSLKTNIQLVYNNAKVGAQIAADYAKLGQ